MRVYFDNAATTPLDPEVFDAMKPFLLEKFGNPSSIHSHGREVRSAIEKARKTVAELLNASPGEIFFTSGGSEADNMAIRSGVRTFGLKHAITDPLEHHAVLHSMSCINKELGTEIQYLNVDNRGNIDLNHLEDLLKNNSQTLVSVMHANNEIGNKNPIEKIAEICKQYDALFHCDTVQTMGHFPHDVKEIGLDFLVGSAHKLHGPKGVGFIYVNGDRKIDPLMHGGSQERGMRGGTENVSGIIGMAKALEIAYREMSEHHQHITEIKSYMIEKLKANVDGIEFNGNSADLDNSLYTVLSVSFPASELSEMLLFNLDIAGISASGGSACTSGANAGSHVLGGINSDPNRPTVRFSFSKYSTKEEVDYVVEKVAEMYKNVTTIA